MKADSSTLQAILHSPNQYVIPIFQRYYSWGVNDWEKLWDDLMELQELEQKGRRHFMGSLVFVPEKLYPNKVPSFQVIDGQQRLITLSLLLCALRDHASLQGFNELSQEIMDNFLTHRFKKDREYYRIYPRQRDRAQYISAVTQRALTEDNIQKAYDYYYKKIESMSGFMSEEGMRDFFDTLRTRLEFVHITLDDENPYRIFKSLNSTGVDLSESDLIRNFVFMHLETSQQDQFDDEYWKPLEKHFEDTEGKNKGNLNGSKFSAFLRDFLMRDGTYIGTNAIFETFETRYRAPFDPAKLAKDLAHDVDLYDIIRGIKNHPSGDTRIDDALTQLRQIYSTTAYPLLLNLMHRVERHEMSNNDLLQAIKLLSGFILRRYVANESSRTYGKWFVQACTEIKQEPLKELRNFLKSKGYPNDNRFQEAFIRFNLYEGNYPNQLLKALEMAHPYKERADISHPEVQVEHIMPQSLTHEWEQTLGPEARRIHSQWCHTPGNLTITRYNPELANKPFTVKCEGWINGKGERVPGYKESGFILTRKVAEEYSTWGEEEIKQRGRKLAELASTLWIGPDE